MNQERQSISALRSKKPGAPASRPTATPQSAVPPMRPPLYRRIDWWTFGATTFLVFFGYLLTLAPDLTLEDSGELAVGSYYAGVPHPPGYPVWTIYTWLFTVLVPISNIAWRVALSSAVAGALACGLLALVVSRGSSMMMEGIESLKNIDRRWENAICIVAGIVAGLLMGFNGYMWSQAVIVEVYTLSVLSLMGVIAFLLRWLYAPEQRRYLYFAFFFFGICLTNHMSLLVAAMGIQIAVAAARPKIGRDLFLANSIIFIIGVILRESGHIRTLQDNAQLYGIFWTIGLGSIAATVWLSIKTGEIGKEWKPVLIMGLMWLAGAAFYLYMPIASMTNPPMNWGYPRTAEGFMHALKRGQYESVRPTDDPGRFVNQVVMYTEGAVDEFTRVYLLIGLLPFVFYRFMQKRERAWLIGLAGIYLFLSVLLLILLNPNWDRQSRELHRVFFTASHVVIAMGIGYGLALVAAFLVTQYERARVWALAGGGVAVLLALYSVVESIDRIFGDLEHLSGLKLIFYGLNASLIDGQNTLAVASAVFLFLLTIAFLVVVWVHRQQIKVPLLLGIFAMMPLHSIMSHWAENEQRGHRFGYWFGHDMFTPPFDVHPEMDRDAVLFGGTDPGRFNPTYMIFCESFIPPKKRHNSEFDRRDVYLITQNALADRTYLQYIRAHYNRSTQIDPPFFKEFFKPLPLGFLDKIFMTIGDRVEKRRRVGTSYFEPDDFKNFPALIAALKPGDGQNGPGKFLYESFSDKTRKLITDKPEASSTRKAVAHELNGIIDGNSLYDAQRFEGIELSPRTMRFVKENPRGHTRVRLNRLLIEEAFAGCIENSPGGVYPDLEIHTPTEEDSQRAFQEYIQDAERRARMGQLKPGEDVRVDGGRVQVSGQVAVMSINALLTKVIFDKNPDHSFYVEESFPLDWMYPYLTPSGIIMKINRQPLADLTEDVFEKDHNFWRQYSTRLIGDWITYDTPVSEIAAFAERLYLRRDYKGFEGDRKFIRDDNAQKAFSKLRSSIGGVYAWRLSAEAPPAYRPKNEADRQRLLREAEFAFKQSFAFCPYSPEAVYRYSSLLLSQNRLEDAVLILRTCLKFDPQNGAIANYLRQVENALVSSGGMDLQRTLLQVSQMIQARQTNEAMERLDHIARTSSDPQALTAVAQVYLQLGNPPKAEQVLLQFTRVAPESPEGWYNLAGLQAAQGKSAQAMASLQRAFNLNRANLAKDPGGMNLRDHARNDPNFILLRQDPAFQKMVESP
jgi:tetratricopeptide (TPR) repeat protein